MGALTSRRWGWGYSIAVTKIIRRGVASVKHGPEKIVEQISF